MVFLVTKAALLATVVGVGVTIGALSYLARRNQENIRNNGLHSNTNYDASGSNLGHTSFTAFPSSSSKEPPPQPSFQGNAPLFSLPAGGFRLFGASSSTFLRDCDCRVIHECSSFRGGAAYSFRLRRTCGFQGFQRKICCDEGPSFFSTPSPYFSLEDMKNAHAQLNIKDGNPTKDNKGSFRSEVNSATGDGDDRTASTTTLHPAQVQEEGDIPPAAEMSQDEEVRPVTQTAATTGKTRLSFPDVNEYFRDDEKEESTGVPLEIALFPNDDDFSGKGRNDRIDEAFGEGVVEEKTTENSTLKINYDGSPSLSEYFPDEEAASHTSKHLATTTTTEATSSTSTTEAIPISSTTEAFPISSTTEAIPITSTTEAIPIMSTTEAIPITSTTEAIPITSTTEAIPITSTTEAIPITSTTEAIPVTSTTEGTSREEPSSFETEHRLTTQDGVASTSESPWTTTLHSEVRLPPEVSSNDKDVSSEDKELLVSTTEGASQKEIHDKHDDMHKHMSSYEDMDIIEIPETSNVKNIHPEKSTSSEEFPDITESIIHGNRQRPQSLEFEHSLVSENLGETVAKLPVASSTLSTITTEEQQFTTTLSSSRDLSSSSVSSNRKPFAIGHSDTQIVTERVTTTQSVESVDEDDRGGSDPFNTITETSKINDDVPRTTENTDASQSSTAQAETERIEADTGHTTTAPQATKDLEMDTQGGHPTKDTLFDIIDTKQPSSGSLSIFFPENGASTEAPLNAGDMIHKMPHAESGTSLPITTTTPSTEQDAVDNEQVVKEENDGISKTTTMNPSNTQYIPEQESQLSIKAEDSSTVYSLGIPLDETTTVTVSSETQRTSESNQESSTNTPNDPSTTTNVNNQGNNLAKIDSTRNENTVAFTTEVPTTARHQQDEGLSATDSELTTTANQDELTMIKEIKSDNNGTGTGSENTVSSLNEITTMNPSATENIMQDDEASSMVNEKDTPPTTTASSNILNIEASVSTTEASSTTTRHEQDGGLSLTESDIISTTSKSSEPDEENDGVGVTENDNSYMSGVTTEDNRIANNGQNIHTTESVIQKHYSPVTNPTTARPNDEMHSTEIVEATTTQRFQSESVSLMSTDEAMTTLENNLPISETTTVKHQIFSDDQQPSNEKVIEETPVNISSLTFSTTAANDATKQPGLMEISTTEQNFHETTAKVLQFASEGIHPTTDRIMILENDQLTTITTSSLLVEQNEEDTISATTSTSKNASTEVPQIDNTEVPTQFFTTTTTAQQVISSPATTAADDNPDQETTTEKRLTVSETTTRKSGLMDDSEPMNDENSTNLPSPTTVLPTFSSPTENDFIEPNDEEQVTTQSGPVETSTMDTSTISSTERELTTTTHGSLVKNEDFVSSTDGSIKINHQTTIPSSFDVTEKADEEKYTTISSESVNDGSEKPTTTDPVSDQSITSTIRSLINDLISKISEMTTTISSPVGDVSDDMQTTTVSSNEPERMTPLSVSEQSTENEATSSTPQTDQTTIRVGDKDEPQITTTDRIDAPIEYKESTEKSLMDMKSPTTTSSSLDKDSSDLPEEDDSENELPTARKVATPSMGYTEKSSVNDLNDELFTSTTTMPDEESITTEALLNDGGSAAELDIQMVSTLSPMRYEITAGTLKIIELPATTPTAKMSITLPPSTTMNSAVKETTTMQNSYGLMEVTVSSNIDDPPTESSTNNVASSSDILGSDEKSTTTTNEGLVGAGSTVPTVTLVKSKDEIFDEETGTTPNTPVMEKGVNSDESEDLLAGKPTTSSSLDIVTEAQATTTFTPEVIAEIINDEKVVTTNRPSALQIQHENNTPFSLLHGDENASSTTMLPDYTTRSTTSKNEDKNVTPASEETTTFRAPQNGNNKFPSRDENTDQEMTSIMPNQMDHQTAPTLPIGKDNSMDDLTTTIFSYPVDGKASEGLVPTTTTRASSSQDVVSSTTDSDTLISTTMEGEKLDDDSELVAEIGDKIHDSSVKTMVTTGASDIQEESTQSSSVTGDGSLTSDYTTARSASQNMGANNFQELTTVSSSELTTPANQDELTTTKEIYSDNNGAEAGSENTVSSLNEITTMNPSATENIMQDDEASSMVNEKDTPPTTTASSNILNIEASVSTTEASSTTTRHEQDEGLSLTESDIISTTSKNSESDEDNDGVGATENHNSYMSGVTTEDNIANNGQNIHTTESVIQKHYSPVTNPTNTARPNDEMHSTEIVEATTTQRFQSESVSLMFTDEAMTTTTASTISEADKDETVSMDDESTTYPSGPKNMMEDQMLLSLMKEKDAPMLETTTLTSSSSMDSATTPLSETSSTLRSQHDLEISTTYPKVEATSTIRVEPVSTFDEERDLNLKESSTINPTENVQDDMNLMSLVRDEDFPERDFTTTKYFVNGVELSTSEAPTTTTISKEESSYTETEPSVVTTTTIRNQELDSDDLPMIDSTKDKDETTTMYSNPSKVETTTENPKTLEEGVATQPTTPTIQPPKSTTTEENTSGGEGTTRQYDEAETSTAGKELSSLESKTPTTTIPNDITADNQETTTEKRLTVSETTTKKSGVMDDSEPLDDENSTNLPSPTTVLPTFSSPTENDFIEPNDEEKVTTQSGPVETSTMDTSTISSTERELTTTTHGSLVKNEDFVSSTDGSIKINHQTTIPSFDVTEKADEEKYTTISSESVNVGSEKPTTTDPVSDQSITSTIRSLINDLISKIGEMTTTISSPVGDVSDDMQTTTVSSNEPERMTPLSVSEESTENEATSSTPQTDQTTIRVGDKDESQITTTDRIDAPIEEKESTEKSLDLDSPTTTFSSLYKSSSDLPEEDDSENELPTARKVATPSMGHSEKNSIKDLNNDLLKSTTTAAPAKENLTTETVINNEEGETVSTSTSVDKEVTSRTLSLEVSTTSRPQDRPDYTTTELTTKATITTEKTLDDDNSEVVTKTENDVGDLLSSSESPQFTTTSHYQPDSAVLVNDEIMTTTSETTETSDSGIPTTTDNSNTETENTSKPNTPTTTMKVIDESEVSYGMKDDSGESGMTTITPTDPTMHKDQTTTSSLKEVDNSELDSTTMKSEEYLVTPATSADEKYSSTLDSTTLQDSVETTTLVLTNINAVSKPTEPSLIEAMKTDSSMLTSTVSNDEFMEEEKRDGDDSSSQTTTMIPKGIQQNQETQGLVTLSPEDSVETTTSSENGFTSTTLAPSTAPSLLLETDGSDHIEAIMASTPVSNSPDSQITTTDSTNEMRITTQATEIVKEQRETESDVMAVKTTETTDIVLRDDEAVKSTTENSVTSTTRSINEDATTNFDATDQDMTTPPNTTPKMLISSTETVFTDKEIMAAGSTMPSLFDAVTNNMFNTETVSEFSTERTDESRATGFSDDASTSSPSTSTTQISTQGDQTTMSENDDLQTTTTESDTGITDYDDISNDAVEVEKPTFEERDFSKYSTTPQSYDLNKSNETSPPTSIIPTILPESTTVSFVSDDDSETKLPKDNASASSVNPFSEETTTAISDASIPPDNDDIKNTVTTEAGMDYMKDGEETTTVSGQGDKVTTTVSGLGDKETTAYSDISGKQSTIPTEMEDILTTTSVYGDNDLPSNTVEQTTLSAMSEFKSTAAQKEEITTIIPSPENVEGTTRAVERDSTGVIEMIGDMVSTTLKEGVTVETSSPTAILQEELVDATTTAQTIEKSETTMMPLKGLSVEKKGVEVFVKTTTMKPEQSTRSVNEDQDFTTSKIGDEFSLTATDKVFMGGQTEATTTLKSEDDEAATGLPPSATTSLPSETHASYAGTTEYPDGSIMTTTTGGDESETRMPVNPGLGVTELSLTKDEMMMGEDGLPITEITKSIRREPDTDKTVVELTQMSSLRKSKVTKTVTAVRSGSEATVSELTTESPLSTTTNGPLEHTTTEVTTVGSEMPMDTTTLMDSLENLSTTEAVTEGGVVFDEMETTTIMDLPQGRTAGRGVPLPVVRDTEFIFTAESTTRGAAITSTSGRDILSTTQAVNAEQKRENMTTTTAAGTEADGLSITVTSIKSKDIMSPEDVTANASDATTLVPELDLTPGKETLHGEASTTHATVNDTLLIEHGVGSLEDIQYSTTEADKLGQLNNTTESEMESTIIPDELGLNKSLDDNELGFSTPRVEMNTERIGMLEVSNRTSTLNAYQSTTEKSIDAGSTMSPELFTEEPSFKTDSSDVIFEMTTEKEIIDTTFMPISDPKGLSATVTERNGDGMLDIMENRTINPEVESLQYNDTVQVATTTLGSLMENGTDLDTDDSVHGSLGNATHTAFMITETSRQPKVISVEMVMPNMLAEQTNQTDIKTIANSTMLPDTMNKIGILGQNETRDNLETTNEYVGNSLPPEIVMSAPNKILDQEMSKAKSLMGIDALGTTEAHSSTYPSSSIVETSITTTESGLPQSETTIQFRPDVEASTEPAMENVDLASVFLDSLNETSSRPPILLTVTDASETNDVPTTQTSGNTEATVSNADLQEIYETLFGSSSARSTSVMNHFGSEDSVDTTPTFRTTTTPEPPFKLEVKVGPYDARSLFSSSSTAVEKQLEGEISNVVSQLLLTTHKNFHLLPTFIECAGARGRTGRRKTKVLHFDTENYPWMARIGFMEPGGVLFPCAGTIISRRYILTSAQCALRKFNGTASVMEILLEGAKNAAAGMSNQFQYKYKVEEVLPHPNYDIKTRENDLALIRLAKEIPSFNGSSEVRPICLPFEDGYGVWDSLPGDGETAYLGGWGYGLKNMAATVEEMHDAAVTIWSNENCTYLYRGDRDKKITPMQICAYGNAEKVTSCRGDIGGPLMALMTRQRIFFQIGVVSYGPRCGYGVPGVYTRVSNYLSWILDAMRP